jgi:hypothetical protein
MSRDFFTVIDTSMEIGEFLECFDIRTMTSRVNRALHKERLKANRDLINMESWQLPIGRRIVFRCCRSPQMWTFPSDWQSSVKILECPQEIGMRRSIGYLNLALSKRRTLIASQIQIVWLKHCFKEPHLKIVWDIGQRAQGWEFLNQPSFKGNCTSRKIAQTPPAEMKSMSPR